MAKPTTPPPGLLEARPRRMREALQPGRRILDGPMRTGSARSSTLPWRSGALPRPKTRALLARRLAVIMVWREKTAEAWEKANAWGCLDSPGDEAWQRTRRMTAP